MLLRLKLLGTGTDRDPYRVPLPTYQHIHGNVTRGYAIVILPDNIHGLTDEELQGETVEETTEGNLYPSLSDSVLQKIHAHFDHTYAEHKGKFRIESA